MFHLFIILFCSFILFLDVFSLRFNSENPDTDFIRSRKLDFKTTISSILCMENGSLKDELYKFFDYSLTTPTSSAFVQSRSKIKMEAFLHC